MSKHSVEIFSAGCPVCEEAIEMVKRTASEHSEVKVMDMKDPVVAARAKQLGIRSIPTVVIDGKLADCCAGRGPDGATLKAAGI
jgi:glutaredoxin 3